MHQGKLKNMIKPLLRSHLLCIRWSLYFMHLKYQLLFPELFLILSQLYATLLTSTCQKNIKARLERCKFLHMLEFPPQSSACHYNHSYPLVLLTSCRNHKGSVLTDLFPVAGSYSPDSPAQGWLHPQWAGPSSLRSYSRTHTHRHSHNLMEAVPQLKLTTQTCHPCQETCNLGDSVACVVELSCNLYIQQRLATGCPQHSHAMVTSANFSRPWLPLVPWDGKENLCRTK